VSEETGLDDEGVPTAAPAAVEGHGIEAAGPEGHGVEGHTVEEPERPRRPRRGLALVCAALAVAALGFAVLAAVSTARLDRERKDRNAVEELSGRFASALLTYDYQDLAGAKKRVLALSTGKFRKEYETAFSGGLDVLFRETKARSAGTVTDVFVGPIQGGTVTTIAVVDAVAQGTAGGRRLVSSYIELQLVKVGGGWKVDGVTNLNLSSPTSDSLVPAPAGAPATTTTTAPSK
jgi:hypothetical protein